jgi:hypothetical protein
MTADRVSLANVLQSLGSAEDSARQQGNNDLANRLASARRKLSEPPSDDLATLLAEAGDGLEALAEALLGTDTWIYRDTSELADELRGTAKRIDGDSTPTNASDTTTTQSDG